MTSVALRNANQLLQQYRHRDGVTYRPPQPQAEPLTKLAPAWLTQLAAEIDPNPKSKIQNPKSELMHYPDVGIAANRDGYSAHYQLWLLLRWLDASGVGWLELAEVTAHVTTANSAAFLYKKPRLRQLLAEGAGRFWHIKNGRIWTHRTARVAAALGLPRILSRPVSIPAAALTAKIAHFRACMFGGWLSLRRNPISQAVIAQLTGIPERTQRRYLRLAGVTVTRNIAIGRRCSAETMQEAAWQHGGTFQFFDSNGRQGAPGRHYVAWHLPASYHSGECRIGAKSARKYINRDLAGLRISERAGNGRLPLLRIYFGAAAAAFKAAAGQETPGDVYWPGNHAKNGTGIWHPIPR